MAAGFGLNCGVLVKMAMSQQVLLYVEDEDSDVLLLKIAFEKVGLKDRFKRAIDGEDAIKYLAGLGQYANRELYPVLCLVLLDLNLPRKNGFEVLEWKREHPLAKRIPFVIFTSSCNPRDIERAYDLGAAGYLIKLPNPEDWNKRAAAIREFWLEYNQPPPIEENEPNT